MHTQHGIGIDLRPAGEHFLERLESRLVLALVLGLVNGEGLAGQVASLQSAAIKAGTVIVETLADHLPALDDDAAMTLTEGGELGLLETQTEVIVELHFWVGSELYIVNSRFQILEDLKVGNKIKSRKSRS